ncbi:MAG: efflux RND transporter periplasmic adaptor subunit [Halioglobus sp.]|nr:efflux RND transporter periplasmic adaptor subunit [Halioglobus sp.]
MAQDWVRKGLSSLLVLAGGLVLSYALLVGKPGPEPREPEEAALPLVDVVVAAPQNQALLVQTQGTVRPLREIKLVSQVSGRVETVSPRFARGGFFAADEPLVNIEDIDYQFMIARAESQVAAAKQQVAEEEGRALQAKREWRDLGSEQGNALFLRKPQLAAAQSALLAAEADLAAARLDLARTSISAPFNGRVSEKNVDIGQFVSPGTVVATVYDTDVAQVRLPLTDRQVALLDLPLNYDTGSLETLSGSHVLLRTRFANRDWEWAGRLVRTDASIDENSRVVFAVAEVDKPFARDAESERPPLAPGLFVSATISGRPLEQVTQLPRSALRTDSTVMVVDGKQRAQSRPVHVLQSDGRYVWAQGLAKGDQVIVKGPGLLLAGTAVAVNVAELAGGEF